MSTNLVYMPVFRARQQEMLVLRSFDFNKRMWPLVEIIKEKDRTSRNQSSVEIYSELINSITAKKVFIDLPSYINDVGGMNTEVISFNRTILSNIENKINYYTSLEVDKNNTIPVISTFLFKTGQENTLTIQYNELKKVFPIIAIRTFTNTFGYDWPEIKKMLTAEDFLIYDIDESVGLTNPIIKRDIKQIETLTGIFKIALRSAINTDIQNIKLEHGAIVYQADNSLMELYKNPLKFNAFGDYAGIKKDDLTAGGTISPGFIFYNPVDNLFYGYRGNLKDLSEFENTIVPAVINSEEIRNMEAENKQYLDDENVGWITLNKIANGKESGKSQAKFKRISMEHYLHCIKVKLGL